MFIFILFFILALAIAQGWSKKIGLRDIKYEYRLNKSAIEIDEPVELVSTISNESRRFVPYIRIVEALPIGAQPLNKKISIRANVLGLGGWFYNSSIYLMARSRLHRKLKLTFDKRGWYVFQGATLYGGDYLGLSTAQQAFPLAKTITVYPKPVRSLYLQQIIGGFLGDISVRRFIMEDPILTIGTREYTGREPLKQMSWKHTARTSKMMVKQFDYTTEMVVTLVLDVDQPKGKVFTEDQFEICYSLARTIAEQLEQSKIPFEFTTNALIAGGETLEQGKMKVTQNLGKAHLRTILDKLGRGSYGENGSFEKIVEKLKVDQKERSDQSIIIITPERDIDKEQLARRLESENIGSILFVYGEDFIEADKPAKEGDWV